MPSGLTPYNWTEDEVITAAKLNALEARVVNGADASVTASNAAQASANDAISGPVDLVSRSTSHTLGVDDAGKVVYVTAGTGITVTVPDEATEAFATGAVVILVRAGAGDVTVSAAAGVTLNSEYGFDKLREQYSTAALVKTGSDVWLLSGGLEPS